MRLPRLLVTLLPLLAAPGVARANGRFPATTNIRFEQQDSSFLLLPTTFGLTVSNDGGQTFRWVCEEAIGYGGTYDPDFAITASGVIYATTFAGLRVSRDGGCSWETIGDPFTNQWVGEVEIASDGRIWATTSTGGRPNDVYVSAGDGQAFASAGLPHNDAWWLSVQTAASNPQRVYVSGFIPEQRPLGGGVIPSESLLRRSVDGGQSWQTLPVSDFTLQTDSQIFLEAVAPQNPDLLFARVFRATAPLGDALYRSLDGGQHWSKILDMSSTMRAVLLRADGVTLLAASDNPCPGDPAGSPNGCLMISHDAASPAGVTFERPAAQPRIGCLGQFGGNLYACAANWEPDFFALGRSSDGQSWEKVMRFSDIAGPLECPGETEQAMTCAHLRWPSVCSQLGICSASDGDGSDAAAPHKGGCNTAAGAASLLIALLLAAGFLALRRRRHSASA